MVYSSIIIHTYAHAHYDYSMLETPDVPSLARVMRVAPRPGEQPAAGFSWGDYEDVDESRITADDADGEDDGWIVKGSNRRPST